MLGKNLSKFSCEGASLNAASKIILNACGTFPISEMSMPLLLNALIAALKSLPNLTYASDTNLSSASLRAH